MPNASNAVSRMAPEIPRLKQEYCPEAPGQIGLMSNRQEVVWAGLPIALPFLRGIRDTGTDYLLAGAFPMLQRTNAPLPAELLAQFVGRMDLMYYDWEITQEALVHARQMWQMDDIINKRILLGTNAPSVKWVIGIAPHLGNTITEVAQTAPNELSLTRKSHIGFTGFELVLLTRWFDSPGFPFNYEPPRKMPHPSKAGATKQVKPAFPAGSTPKTKPVPNIKSR